MLTLLQPENQGPVNPALPLHPPLVLDCGANGGVISNITFASFGLPVGYCGNFEIESNCSVDNSTQVVESLCLGKVTHFTSFSVFVLIRPPSRPA